MPHIRYTAFENGNPVSGLGGSHVIKGQGVASTGFFSSMTLTSLTAHNLFSYSLPTTRTRKTGKYWASVVVLRGNKLEMVKFRKDAFG